MDCWQLHVLGYQQFIKVTINSLLTDLSTFICDGLVKNTKSGYFVS